MLETHNVEVLCSQTFAIILKCLNHMQKRPHCHMCCAGIFNKVLLLSYSLKVCSHLCADNVAMIIENLQLNSDLIKDLNLL